MIGKLLKYIMKRPHVSYVPWKRFSDLIRLGICWTYVIMKMLFLLNCKISLRVSILMYYTNSHWNKNLIYQSLVAVVRNSIWFNLVWFIYQSHVAAVAPSVNCLICVSKFCVLENLVTHFLHYPISFDNKSIAC